MPKIPKIKNKRLYYRRAVWQGSNQKTLETYLKEAHEHFQTTSSRRFSGGSSGVEILGAHFKYKDKSGLFLQVVSYVPDQPTSTITKASTAPSSMVEEAPAPMGKDYLEGDIFILVNKNDVIILPSGARENVALAYFCHILEKFGMSDISATLDLEKIAKYDKIKMIQNEGVKAIELNSSLYEASIDHINARIDKSEPKFSELRKAIAEQIKRIFSKDPTLKEIQEKENINISLTIRFDGKEARKHTKEQGFGEVGKTRLAKASEMLLKESDELTDGFAIVTGDGNRITSNEIVVSDNYRIETFGKSLDRSNAWDKLEEYYYQLDNRGIVKQ